MGRIRSAEWARVPKDPEEMTNACQNEQFYVEIEGVLTDAGLYDAETEENKDFEGCIETLIRRYGMDERTAREHVLGVMDRVHMRHQAYVLVEEYQKKGMTDREMIFRLMDDLGMSPVMAVAAVEVVQVVSPKEEKPARTSAAVWMEYWFMTEMGCPPQKARNRIARERNIPAAMIDWHLDWVNRPLRSSDASIEILQGAMEVSLKYPNRTEAEKAVFDLVSDQLMAILEQKKIEYALA